MKQVLKIDQENIQHNALTFIYDAHNMSDFKSNKTSLCKNFIFLTCKLKNQSILEEKHGTLVNVRYWMESYFDVYLTSILGYKEGRKNRYELTSANG